MPPVNIYYLFLLVVAFACESRKTSSQTNPDAVRDLLVDRITWKAKAVPDRPGVQCNEHRFAVTNTSGQYNYRQIQVRFDYYDAQYHRLGSERYTLPQLIEARSMVTIPPIQIGTANPLAKSATVRIEQALSE